MSMMTKQTLGQTQNQQLALSQHMRHSLRLLRMNAADASSAIDAERQRNPFLTRLDQVCPARHAVEEMAASQTSPIDQVLQQIGLLRLSNQDRRRAEDLARCLDWRGFLAEPADQLCRLTGLQPSGLIKLVDTLQQELEPAGLFAWSLKDCFRLQLQARNRWDPMIAELVERLDLVAKQDFAAIGAVLNVDAEDAQSMLDDIRALTPCPLAPAEPVDMRIDTPDMIIRAQADGAPRAELNPAAFPKVLTNDALFSKVAVTETDRSAHAYYRDCYRMAGAYVLALQKRANTLLRIGRILSEAQAKFLSTGRPDDMRPLTRAQIAGELGLHKSTVGRALGECLIETDHGVTPADAFLVRAIGRDTPSRTRNQALKRLSLLIRTEQRHAPLSDLALSRHMARAGFPISRRTVAKYRDLLGAPNAHVRRTTPRQS